MSRPKIQPSNWNLPNFLTVVRLFCVPILGLVLFLYPTEFSWRIAATVIFMLGIFTDFVDGKLARAYGMVTDFGKLWDPIADKALTGLAFVALSLLGELPWWVTILILLREWGITALRGAILKYGVMAANAGGKVKTAMQSLALTLYLPGLAHYPVWLQYFAAAVMALAFLLTVITGVVYLWEAWQMKKAYEAKHGK